MLKTIILDCDGVMFDSKNANRHYYNFLLGRFQLPEMDESELEYVHIHNVYDSIEHIFAKAPQLEIAAVHRFRQEHSYLPFLQYMHMEPDLIAFLEAAYPTYNLAIATNRADTMLPLLAEFCLSHYFGKVMTADNSKRPKPAADPIMEITEHFGCRIDESIYVGDSIVDQETAENSGIQLIAFRNEGLKAEYYVENFLQILDLPPFGS